MTPLRLLLAAPLVVAVTVLVALLWPGESGGPAAQPVGPDPAVEVLRDWDQRRAAAWASADPGALSALYADGSRAGSADAALLEEYVARGISVDELRMQLLAVSVVKRLERRLVLVVTDRLAGVVARHGRRILHLPHDRPSTHRVSLVSVDGRWLVEEVRPVRS